MIYLKCRINENKSIADMIGKCHECESKMDCWCGHDRCEECNSGSQPFCTYCEFQDACISHYNYEQHKCNCGNCNCKNDATDILLDDAFIIKEVIFNPPATIIFWKDGTKTVVKCQQGELFDAEKGLAMAYIKRLLGNTGAYNELFKLTGATKYNEELEEARYVH